MNRRGSKGSLLVITLWLVTILGALSIAVARYLSTEVRLTRYRLARQEARELARSGVSLALAILQKDQKETPTEDWSGDLWAVPLTVSPAPGRQLTVTMTDEERKLNVNTATLTQLSSLLGNNAQAIVDYASAKDHHIAALEELNDLDKTARALLQANATPYTTGTAQNEGGPLNINTATQPAMLAYGLSEDTVNRIDEVLRTPNGRFKQPGTILSTLGWDITDPTKAGEGILLSSMMTSSSVFLVVTEGIVEQPEVHVRIQAVIRRSTSTAAPTIVAWKEG